MATSIFNRENNQAFINRINNLQVDSKRQWGKMNVSQMLAHCRQPLLVASGELKLKRSILGLLFGNWAKKKFITQENFDKDLPTDKSFIIKDERNFAEEKNALINLVRRFETTGPGIITLLPHPFFGKLSKEEWDSLQTKHLDHHLKQFGV